MSTVQVARPFVILNPGSGTSDRDEVCRAIARHFGGDQACDIHELRTQDNMTELARKAADRGCPMIVAAGGDGTVSSVAGGLVNTDSKLGILPLGTGNVLARDLGIPVELDDAVALLAGPHRVRRIDAIRVGDRHFFTQIGIGIDAEMIRGTRKEHKKRFGRVAYLWTLSRSLLGFRRRRFAIESDGPLAKIKASQVIVANSGTLGQAPYRWGPDIRLDDGRLNVCIVRAKSLRDLIPLFWRVFRGRHHEDPNLRFHVVDREATIRTDRPLPVQADGEIIGETPVTFQVVAGAVGVVVPEDESLGADAKANA